MFKLGIFAKTFTRPSFGEVLDAVLLHHLKIIHFNYSCLGLSSMPDEISANVVNTIRQETENRGIQIAGVSGTFNIIDPDLGKRKKGMERLRVIANTCHGLNTQLISICTGTRNAADMWKGHPENSSLEAWKDMIVSMKEIVKIAEEFNVCIGIEPEFANIIDSPQNARRLLDELGSKHLKIILDPANLFNPPDVPHMKEIIKEAFDLLKNDIVMGHAKDFRVENNQIVHVPAGQGILDYDFYLQLLEDFDVPLIIHGLKEEEVDSAINFILSKTKVRK